MEKFQKIAQTHRPDKAVVSAVTFVEYSDEVEDIEVFASRFQARQLRKGISSIIRIEEKQDKMIDKLEDVRHDVVVEIRSSSDAIVSEIRESRERSTVEVRDSHADLKSYLDERLGKMDEDITRIKARIGM